MIVKSKEETHLERRNMGATSLLPRQVENFSGSTMARMDVISIVMVMVPHRLQFNARNSSHFYS